jgi:pimeloyl-ACP methyl ester carboxylesterase
LLGHSRGGAEALLAATGNRRVKALVTWSAYASAHNRWNEQQIETWRAGGTVFVPNARTGQDMPIGPSLWHDLVQNGDRLDVLANAARVKAPWLIVHGEADETVPVGDAHTLFAVGGPRTELCVIEGASHTYGAKHPYSGPTLELKTAAQTTLSWLDEHLG